MKTFVTAAVVSCCLLVPQVQAKPADLATFTDASVKAFVNDFLSNQLIQLKNSILTQAEQALLDVAASVEEHLTPSQESQSTQVKITEKPNQTEQ